VTVKCLQVIEELCEGVCCGDVTRMVWEVDVLVKEEVADREAFFEHRGSGYCR
jgi:hypothetical protein